MILIFADKPVRVTALEVEESMLRDGIRVGVGQNNQLGHCALSITKNCKILAHEIPPGFWFGDGVDCNFEMRLYHPEYNMAYSRQTLPLVYLSWASIDFRNTDPVILKYWVQKLVEGGVSEILKT